MSTNRLGLPFSLGKSYTPAQARKFFAGGGAWIELNADGHFGCAFIVTRMEDDEVSQVEQDRAEFIVRACNSHDALLEYFRAAELFASTSGSESATVEQERAAEERFDRAGDAVRALLRAEMLAAAGVKP